LRGVLLADLTVSVTEALGVVPTQIMQILSRDGKENQTGNFELKSIGRNRIPVECCVSGKLSYKVLNI
jgi:hypothetical protein